jgi:DNA-directed RNA polymerase II subunit RPB1
MIKQPSRIIGIQFSILSPEEIRRTSVAHITSRETYINNKPVIGGIFDPRMGVLDPGLICPTDGLNYMKTPGYFGHIELARPVFYIQYLSTLIKILKCICIKCSGLKISKDKYKSFLTLSPKKRWAAVYPIASKIKRCGYDTRTGCGCLQPTRIVKEGLATLLAEWKNVDGLVNPNGEKEKLMMKLTPEIVIKIFRRIKNEDVSFLGFSPTFSRPEWMVCQVMAVPPPAVRPSVKHDAQQRSEDDISHIIVTIIKANNTLREKIRLDAPSNVIDDWHTVLQYYIATMIDNRIPGVASVAQRSGRALKSIKDRLGGKGGRVRGNLMGKRVDFSARSVITPDPNIGIGELGVPLQIAKNITVPVTVNKRNRDYLTQLVRNGPDEYPGAKILEKKHGESISLKYTDRTAIVLEEGDIIHRHLIDGDPILFNRQPTLHRMSMMCHLVKVLKIGATFRLNVAVTKPYNADFDGDEMNLHGPQDDESAVELKLLAAVPRHIISPADNKSIIGIFQDSLLGSFRLTRSSVSFNMRQAMNLLMSVVDVDPTLFADAKGSITSFELLSQIMPPLSGDFENRQHGEVVIKHGEYISGQLDKKVYGAENGLLQSICNDFNNATAEEFINNMQNIVTDYMKTSSYSVGISDLIANKTTDENITKVILQKKQSVMDIIHSTHNGTFINKTGKTNEDEFETQVNNHLKGAVKDAGNIGRDSLDADNRFVTMVGSGSKGAPINIAQMVSCLGQQNVDGKRIPYGFQDRSLPHYTKFDDTPEARGFIESSFIQGLAPEELFFHAMSGRVGLIDTAVKTSQTGYIQRRLIKSLEDLKLEYDGTVRNAKNKIIQFRYGDDNIDPTKVETQQLPLASMTIESIYKHTAIPIINNDLFPSINYTAETQKRCLEQSNVLKQKTIDITTYLITQRDAIVKHIFNYSSTEDLIHIPVAFERIIGNIQNSLQYKPDSLVDITPYEMYTLIDENYQLLNNMHYGSPTELFKLAYYYHLTPTRLLSIKRFTQKGITLLCARIRSVYVNSLCHPGEMVGVIAAQSIGEPTTQMTLNTFHFAGVAGKSNVTRGVPRIEEILSLSENPKAPSTTIHLHPNDERIKDKATELIHAVEYTCLHDVIESVSICFDPNDKHTKIAEDTLLMHEYYEFCKTVGEHCTQSNPNGEENALSNWILRIVLNRELMCDKDITMDDIHFALEKSYAEDISCIYSDYNADNLVMRVRLSDKLITRNKKSLDEADHIYKLKNIQQNIMNNIILRGVKHIPKALIRMSPNRLIPSDGDFEKHDTWVLDTVGTNLADILTMPKIDSSRTTSNDIQEVYRTLGIEAARQCIYNELIEAFDESYINHHHLSILCDRITATYKMVSVVRHGINKDDIGPIAKASFEETPEMFLSAARHGELDPMTGVSANIMCGQIGYFGTGSFSIVLDLDPNEGIYKLKKKIIIADNIDDLSDDVPINKDDDCSLTNIKINHDDSQLEATDTGQLVEDYNLGF